MKTKILIICIIAFAICLAFWFWHPSKPEKNASMLEEATLTNQQPAASSKRPSDVAPPQNTNAANIGKFPPRPTQSDISNIQQQALAEWQKPIEFYGKVIDENSNAIEGASVQFQWSGRADKDGGIATTQSDGVGLFSLQGKRGRSWMFLSVKRDIMLHERTKLVFYILWDQIIYSPDPQNPVIFHLHKNGNGESLIHIAGIGLHTMRDFLLAADGKPTEVSLRDGRLAPCQGDLEVAFYAGPPLDNFPSRISWQCQVTIPGGGLIQTDEEFPFLAPENGYQASDGWSITATNWTEEVDKQYYVKLRDGNFGRVKFRVIGVPESIFTNGIISQSIWLTEFGACQLRF